jgi:hypothetical protein
MADHNRPDAVAVAAVVITVAVPIAVPIAVVVSITVPAPIVIVIIEAARAAEAFIAKPAAYAIDLLDDAKLVLRRSNIGGTSETDRVGAVGQQRGADKSYGGGQRHQQELVHFGPSSLSAVMAWMSRFSKPGKRPRSSDFGFSRRSDQIAGTSRCG